MEKKWKKKLFISFMLIITMMVSAQNVPVYAMYTKTASDVAMEAFQEYCYNQNTKLYYNNTDQQGMAAIWTHAIFWNIVLDAYERTGDMKYVTLSNDIFSGGYAQYAQYDWNNQTVWFVFDDLMWWIISMARAYQLTGNTDCLNTAIDGFNNVYSRAYDTINGGVFWGFGPDGMGRGHKNSCINYPTIIASMELYQITNEPRYLQIAMDIYTWARANLFDANTGSVPDLVSDEGEVDWTNYTYNQGTMIGAASMLYLATRDSNYLIDANLAANYTKTVMCNRDGILPAEGDWNEQGCMKAIFAHYIGILINDCGQTQWLPWIYDNINAAWMHRDTGRNLMYRDYTIYCSNGMIQSYEACSAVAFMQIFQPNETEAKGILVTPSVTVYQDDQYSGKAATLRPGRYTLEALLRTGAENDWMTSLKVPFGMTLQVFSDDNFQGDMWEYNLDCPNVGNDVNDQMSSCIVYYKEGVTFYQDDLFGGECVTLTKGCYTAEELQELGIPVCWMSSIAIPEEWSVIVYSEDNFLGAMWKFGRGTHNVGEECNDSMMSVRIF